MAEKYDDVLLPFLSLMRKELHANSRKGDRPGWLAMDANTALLEVYWHTAKLSAAVKNNDGPAIMEHSADVANMAMMVLDTCGGLAFVEQSHPTAADVERCRLLDELILSWQQRGDSPEKANRRIAARAAIEAAWPRGVNACAPDQSKEQK
jgi:hypothetical protein